MPSPGVTLLRRPRIPNLLRVDRRLLPLPAFILRVNRTKVLKLRAIDGVEGAASISATPFIHGLSIDARKS
jgi:hypothetical protein